MKIVLSIEDIELGYLAEHNEKYLFCANGDEILRAQKEYPLDMLLFKLNSKGMEVYENIPYPFNTFLAGVNRSDIIKKTEIEENDTDFVKLYKLAGLEIMRENFDIHRAD